MKVSLSFLDCTKEEAEALLKTMSGLNTEGDVEDDEAPAPKKTRKKKAAPVVEDDEDEVEESEDEEIEEDEDADAEDSEDDESEEDEDEDEAPAPKKKKAAASAKASLTQGDVAKIAKQVAKKYSPNGVKKVQGILKKNFQVTGVSELKATQYAKAISALKAVL